MTNTRKFAAFAASVLAAACMAAPMATSFSAAAADTYTIIINNDAANHTYEAYQIFAGDLTVEGESKILTNIEWGSGVKSGDAVVADLVTKIQEVKAVDGSTPFAEKSEASEIAEILAANNTDATLAKNFADAVNQALRTVTGTSTVQTDDSDGDGVKEYKLEELAAGYYLVKDKATTQTGKHDAYTDIILQVAGNVSAEPKTGYPEVVKKVQENSTNTVTGYTGHEETRAQYNDVADYSIGDAVPFALYGTMPDNLIDYKTYKYIFHDTMSAGLAFDASSVTVTTEGKTVDPDCYTVNTSAIDGCTFEVVFNDVLTLKVDDEAAGTTTGAAITVDSGSVIRVDYTATLNTDAVIGHNGNPNEVYLEYSNNPNTGGEGDTGKTPEDKVIVFTYELDVDKTNGSDKLPGAEFILYKKVEDTLYAASVDNGIFKGWVQGTFNDDNTVFTAADGQTLTPTVLSTGTDTYAQIVIKGLDEGVYYLRETKEPSSYNKLANEIKLEIEATTENSQDWKFDGTDAENAAKALTALQLKVDDKAEYTDEAAKTNAAAGKVATSVINQKGSELPSTGGIGTTIFYVGGGALAVGAGVLLVTKKRMANK